MSEGLIFLTNEGDIVNKILRAGNNHKKEYIVRVEEEITDEFIFKMGNGVKILGVTTKKCEVSKRSKHSFSITLVQGLNRQIRRMCEALGFHVTKLMRVRIMNIELGNLKPGEFRSLEIEEMATIDRLVSGNSGTEEMSLKS
jgi:23S rRNA pseudouridine2604 synthase